MSGKTKRCCTSLAFPKGVNLHTGRHVCLANSVSLTHISNPLLKALEQESEMEIAKENFSEYELYVICSHL